MSLRLNPPFRAENIGSFNRPTQLLAKRAEFDRQKCTAEDLKAAEDMAISEIIQTQRDIGIKSLTDGEFRRYVFFDGLFNNLEGMQYIPEVPDEQVMAYVPGITVFEKLKSERAESYTCAAKLKRTKPFYVSQFEELKRLTKPEEHGNIKITMCTPEWYHLRHGPYAYPKDIYNNDDEYFADVAIVYQEELRDLYAAGCRNVQIDDPLFAYFFDESMIKHMGEAGVDRDALFDTYIRAHNNCLKGKPADMTVGLHLCRGNFKGGRHFSEGGYDRIAAKLFTEMAVDCFYLEYDTERAGTFEPLKFLPRDKSVVLGLVSSKFAKMEDKEYLKRRVYEAAEVIANGQVKRSKEEALNQICISPQCGFAPHFEGDNVTEEVMKQKLTLVVEIAREIWSDVPRL